MGVGKIVSVAKALLEDLSVTTNGVYSPTAGADAKVGIATNTNDVAVATGTPTTVVYVAESFDNDTMVDIAGNDDRVTAQTAGTALAFCFGTWNGNASGNRRFLLRQFNSSNTELNRSAENAWPGDANGFDQYCFLLSRCSVGDYWTWTAIQDSGSERLVQGTVETSVLAVMVFPD